MTQRTGSANALHSILGSYVSFQTVRRIHVGMEQLAFQNPAKRPRASVPSEGAELLAMMVRGMQNLATALSQQRVCIW